MTQAEMCDDLDEGIGFIMTTAHLTQNWMRGSFEYARVGNLSGWLGLRILWVARVSNDDLVIGCSADALCNTLAASLLFLELCWGIIDITESVRGCYHLYWSVLRIVLIPATFTATNSIFILHKSYIHHEWRKKHFYDGCSYFIILVEVWALIVLLIAAFYRQPETSIETDSHKARIYNETSRGAPSS